MFSLVNFLRFLTRSRFALILGTLILSLATNLLSSVLIGSKHDSGIELVYMLMAILFFAISGGVFLFADNTLARIQEFSDETKVGEKLEDKLLLFSETPKLSLITAGLWSFFGLSVILELKF